MGPSAKSRNTTLNRFDPRNIYHPEVTSGATSGLCCNPNFPVLANISTVVDPTDKHHNVILHWYDPAKTVQAERDLRSHFRFVWFYILYFMFFSYTRLG